MTFLFFKKKSFKTGVTLTELLVVIAIISIITAIMVINFRAGERGGKLVRSAQLLVQGIRNAQNMSLASKEIYNSGTTSYEVPEGGYVVLVSETSPNNAYYIIYADFDNKQDYDDPSEKIEKVELEEGIVFENIYYDPSGGEPAATHIIFIPLNPLITLFRPLIPPADQIIITLKKENADDCLDDCRIGNTCATSPGCRAVKILKAGWVTIIE